MATMLPFFCELILLFYFSLLCLSQSFVLVRVAMFHNFLILKMNSLKMKCGILLSLNMQDIY